MPAMASPLSAASQQFIFVTPIADGAALDGSDIGAVLPLHCAGHRLKGVLPASPYTAAYPKSERPLFRARLAVLGDLEEPLRAHSGRIGAPAPQSECEEIRP